MELTCASATQFCLPEENKYALTKGKLLVPTPLHARWAIFALLSIVLHVIVCG